MLFWLCVVLTRPLEMPGTGGMTADDANLDERFVFDRRDPCDAATGAAGEPRPACIGQRNEITTIYDDYYCSLEVFLG